MGGFEIAPNPERARIHETIHARVVFI